MRSVTFRFASDSSHDALIPQPKNESTTTHRPRSIQTRRRTDLPDTTTVTTKLASTDELILAKLHYDSNRETHYLPPKLKGRILR